MIYVIHILEYLMGILIILMQILKPCLRRGCLLTDISYWILENVLYYESRFTLICGVKADNAVPRPAVRNIYMIYTPLMT